MSVTRKGEEKAQQSTHSVKEPLPPAARYIDELEIPDPLAQFAEAKLSYHTIMDGLKGGKKLFVKFLQGQDATYASYDPQKLLSESCKLDALPASTIKPETLSASQAAQAGLAPGARLKWPVPVFEAFMADIFRIAHRDLAPNITVFYDPATEETVCHGSTELIGFKTNHSKPLCVDKLFIGTLDEGAKEARDLIHKLRMLINHLNGVTAAAKKIEDEEKEKEKKEEVSTSWMSTFTTSYVALKKHAYSFISSEASLNVIRNLLPFISDKSLLNERDIREKLLPILHKRKSHIGISKEREKENKLLDEIILSANAFADAVAKKQKKDSEPVVRISKAVSTSTLMLPATPTPQQIAIAKRNDIQGFYRSESGKELTPEIIRRFEKYSKQYGPTLSSFMDKPNHEVTANDNRRSGDNSIIITIADLLNYRVIRGVTEVCTKSFHYKEGDLHNENLSTTDDCQARVDHDMSQDDISHQFKDKNTLEYLSRTPNEKTYKYTNDLLDGFPFVNNLWYFPTLASTLSSSKLDFLSSIIANYNRHLFKEEDNVVFQRLASEPMAIFHMYRSWLELMLTPDDLYVELCQSQMQQHTPYKNKSTGKAEVLPKDLLESILKRKQELIAVAVRNKAFRNFLEHYGDCALEIIKDNFSEYQKHHLEKSQKVKYRVMPDGTKVKIGYTYARKIAETIDFGKMDKDFEKIKFMAANDVVAFDIGDQSIIVHPQAASISSAPEPSSSPRPKR